MIKRRYFLTVVCLVLASLACTQFIPGTDQNSPKGSIVYQTNQYGNFELVSIDLNTEETVRLTNNSANDTSPAYIASAQMIGFTSDANNALGLYTMDLTGGNTREVLSEKTTYSDYAAWSPDGQTIAASVVENCDTKTMACLYDIYTMTADGRNLQNLMPTTASEWVPSWSPDGGKIAFSSDLDGDSEVYVMDKNGANLVQLTDNDGYDGRPRWSPDGKRIAFESDRDGGDWDIYLMDPDGSHVIPVTTNATSEFSQSWSPDGKWLVYVSVVDVENEIFIIDVNGQNQTRITTNQFNDTSPVWIP